jgi:hypothetical protein
VVKIAFDDGGTAVIGPGESATISARVRVSPTDGSRWQAALIDYAVLLDSKDAR